MPEPRDAQLAVDRYLQLLAEKDRSSVESRLADIKGWLETMDVQSLILDLKMDAVNMKQMLSSIVEERQKVPSSAAK